MVARSSRPRHSGSRLPGRRYESSRHGLAASRPRTPGSGAMRSFHRHEAFQPLWDTPHCSDATGGPVAPLPVRHPGPRVTAAGCCTPAPSGPATTAAQSGQRHASYHPPRPVMSAARDKMLSTPCRARLRAARHYRIAPPGDMPRKAPSTASGRRSGSDGHASRTAHPTTPTTPPITVSLARALDQRHGHLDGMHHLNARIGAARGGRGSGSMRCATASSASPIGRAYPMVAESQRSRQACRSRRSRRSWGTPISRRRRPTRPQSVSRRGSFSPRCGDDRYSRYSSDQCARFRARSTKVRCGVFSQWLPVRNSLAACADHSMQCRQVRALRQNQDPCGNRRLPESALCISQSSAQIRHEVPRLCKPYRVLGEFP